MKTLFLDCSMGAAGDMLTASLLELLDDPDKAIEELNALNIPKVKISKETVSKCAIDGTHFSVLVDGVEEESLDVHEHEHHHHDEEEHCHCHEHEEEHHHHHDDEEHCHCHEHEHEHEHDHEHHHHHSHTHLHDIEHIISHLEIPEKVKKDVIAVYTLIAEAESKAHGMPMTDIHFHEVGTMDAVADIVSCCYLMNKISPDEVIATPVHVGSGSVHCAHGVLPVPAPATAHILRGVPIYSTDIKGELCTPTGAALLKHFVTRFDKMPVMSVEKFGYGMGKKDFSQANCVRAALGETEEKSGDVLELSCNIDDMTGEKLGYALEALMNEGALDAWTMPIGMKKSRPATMFSVLCREEDKERIVKAIFKYTTTIGIREAVYKRYTLDRTIEKVSTPYGEIDKKVSTGYGVKREKFEYEDILKISKETGKSISEIEETIKNC